ncbi:ribonuclease E inhibitor RraB, partial [Salmonella enterica subsp. enterica serovar Montevideo]|nr:ribonuclease E inhibitor RraB [Salmonella enterica subsp. enterica serovar Montevideo]
ALYTIEHHLSADDFETLEKAAVEAFKLGYEVTEPEELEVEEGMLEGNELDEPMTLTQVVTRFTLRDMMERGESEEELDQVQLMT